MVNKTGHFLFRIAISVLALISLSCGTKPSMTRGEGVIIAEGKNIGKIILQEDGKIQSLTVNTDDLKFQIELAGDVLQTYLISTSGYSKATNFDAAGNLVSSIESAPNGELSIEGERDGISIDSKPKKVVPINFPIPKKP